MARGTGKQPWGVIAITAVAAAIVMVLTVWGFAAFVLDSVGEAIDEESASNYAGEAVDLTDPKLSHAQRLRREGLSKILEGMEDHGAPPRAISNIEDELAGLGGPLPAEEAPADSDWTPYAPLSGG